MKLLDEKTEPSLYGLGFGNGFLDMTPKVYTLTLSRVILLCLTSWSQMA